MSHQHHAAHSSPKATPKIRIVLALMLAPFIIATIVGLIALHPAHRTHATPANLGAPAQLVNGTVTNLASGPCAGDPSQNRCDTVAVAITSGPDKGSSTTLSLQEGPGQPQLKLHDHIVLGRSTDSFGTTTYYFSDFQRKLPLAIMGLVFAVLVVLVARWRGVGAIVGLGFTWLAVTQYLLPAILEGKSPVAEALLVSACIVLVVQYLAHGFRASTTVAVIGTLTSLACTGALAYLAIHFSHVTGMSSEETTYVQTFAGSVNVQGLLLAGIILGSLGVLNDMTVTQASAAWELHIANPERSRTSLYRSTMRIGRDHIASTVYTLVLAYTGAALPLLILFTLSGRHTGDVFASDVVGEEVVRALVGSIGLVLSVPITTALAAIVVKSQPIRREDVIASRDEIIVAESIAAQDEPEDATEATTVGSEEPVAVMEVARVIPKKPRRIRKTRPIPSFEDTRQMSRRERKFWSDS